MDARIKAVLTEIQAICRANDCDGACPFAGVGSKRCAFGTDPVGWEFHIFTKPERDLLRLTGAKSVSRVELSKAGSKFVMLWTAPPQEGGQAPCSPDCFVGQFPATLFPSVPPGVCWDVTVLLGEDEADHGE